MRSSRSTRAMSASCTRGRPTRFNFPNKCHTFPLRNISSKVHRYSSTSSGLTIGSTASKSDSNLKSRGKKKKKKRKLEENQVSGVKSSASTVFDVNELSRMNKPNKFLTSSKSSNMETSLTEKGAKKRKPKLKNQKKPLFPSIFTGIASSISAVDLRCPNQKSSSDSELMKSSEHNYQKSDPDNIEQNCQRLPKSSCEQDHQERGKSERHKYWNSSDPELMISTGQDDQEAQTGKGELLQNSSDSQLLKSSKLKYEKARAESEMKHQFLSMRSCSSLPDLLSSERRTIWTRRNSLRSVSAFNHTVDQLQICSPAIMRCKEPGAMPRPRSEGFRYFHENCHFHSANTSAANNYMRNFISSYMIYQWFLVCNHKLHTCSQKFNFHSALGLAKINHRLISWSSSCQYMPNCIQ